MHFSAMYKLRWYRRRSPAKGRQASAGFVSMRHWQSPDGAIISANSTKSW